MSKKVILVIILIVLLAVVILVVTGMNKATPAPQPVKSSQTNVTTAPAPVKLTEVDKTKLPDRFPADVPIEAGATITLNYNAVNAKGLFQASREFVSKKSMADNFTLYQKALTASGWTITSAMDQPNQKIILATKGANNLNIRIYTDPTGQVKVSINNETQP